MNARSVKRAFRPAAAARNAGRRPAPWVVSLRPAGGKRGTAALATPRWMTADIADRRAAPTQAGGFDQRFPRAFREDADLALRIRDQGWTLHRGNRKTTHPVHPAGPWASLRARVAGRDRRVRGAAHPPGPRAPRHIPRRPRQAR